MQYAVMGNWQELYQDLCRETDLLFGSGDSRPARSEACFRCSLRYWQQLKKMVLRQPFADDREETQFFKYIKPQFTGRMEYYMLVYCYHLGRPGDDVLQLIGLLAREQQKIERFRDAQQDFLAYYASGRTDQDKLFFLRRHRVPHGESTLHPYVLVYDQDPAFTTTSDWVLTYFVGYNLYEKFLAQECDRLKTR